jgi:hypothetical protein
MKVKFIKPPAPLGLAYFQGDEAEFEDKQAQSLIDAKFAVAIEEPKPKKKKAE